MELATFISGTVLAFIAVGTPIIIGLVEVIKRSSDFLAKFSPVIAIILGAIFGWFFGSFGGLSWNILAGVITGLSACGLYSGTVKTSKTIKEI